MNFVPHDYQKFVIDQIVEKPYIGLFLEMGLGKTSCTLTAIDKLRKDYAVDKVLVIAPLRVARDVWSDEIGKWDHIRHLRLVLVLGNPTQRRKALAEDADIWVINRDNVEWLVQEYGDKWPFDMVVIDELSSFKSHSARRFKALRRVRPFMSRVVGLTGTPAPNGMIDLWPQIYLLDQGQRLGKTVGQYRREYFTPNKRSGHVVYNWKQQENADQEIYDAIKDIVVSMKTCDYLELPPRTDVDIAVKMNDQSQDLYKQLERDLLLPFEDEDITAQTAAALSGKLLQLASGAVYDDARGVKLIHDTKLEALEELIEAANGKPVLLFFNYRHSLQRIQERFKFAETLGNIDRWNNGEIKLLCLHPASAGHGLNLQGSPCQLVVWFDQMWSLELVMQANARVYRQGQKKPITIARLVTQGTIDEDVISAVGDKNIRQDQLMQAVKARIGKLN